MDSNVPTGHPAAGFDNILESLFRRILEQLADTDIFSKPDAPSIFVVYAHDNKEVGTANASCVISLIQWLQKIRSRIISDRAPLPLLFSRKDGSDSVRNILSNQFCLLPEKSPCSEDGTIHRVDKVLVFGSEVLRRYYHDPFTSPYLNAIKTAYTKEQTQLNHSKPSEQAIRDVVEAHCHRKGFHHVITELGLLDIRSSFYGKHPESIIPVTLDEDLRTPWLHFLKNCDLVMKLKSPAKAHLHQLFFKLLGRIYIDEHRLINQYKECYDLTIAQFGSEPDLLESRATQIIDTAISKTQSDLREIENAALRGLRGEMKALGGAKLQHDTIRGVFQEYFDDVIRTPLEDKEFKSIVNWLSTCHYWDHHKSVFEKVMPGSGSWITNHFKYQDWLHSPSSSTLFVHGVRGCGKSSILSVAIKQLLDQSQQDPTRLSVAYYYCSGAVSEPERASPDAILRSILSQIAVDHNARVIDPIIVSQYGRLAQEKGSSVRLGLNSCLQLFHELTSKRTIVIVLDAVDELKSQDRSKLIQGIESIIMESDGLIKVLISSRNDAQIERLLDFAAKIEISPELNHQDIESFVEMQLTSIVRGRSLLVGEVSQTLQDRIRAALISGAQEMFLWIELQVKVLIDKKTEKDIEIILDHGLIDSLYQIYDETYEAFVASDDTAKAVIEGLFCWILYVKHPLTKQALVCALRSHPRLTDVSLPDLFHVSFNLVVEDSTTGIMRFCHPSARDYMRDRTMFSEEYGNLLIATACLQRCLFGPWISFPGVSSLDKIEDLDFYAGFYWPQHLKASESSAEVSRCVVESLSTFMLGGEDDELALDFYCWLNWLDSGLEQLPPYHNLKITHECIFSSGEPSPIFTASTFGLGIVFDLLVKRGLRLDLEQRSRTHHPPLYLACLFGHHDVASTLLQYGADPNIVCGSRGNPLQVACFYGHLDIVKTLLGYGASRKPGTPPFKNALHAACEGNQAHVANYLIAASSMIETGSEYGDALQMTAEAGFIDAVDHLTKLGVASSFGRKNAKKEGAKGLALSSIKKGRVDILQSLLKTGQTSREDIPQDAMAIVASYGHSDMIDYLRSLGLSIESEGKFGSPLRSASLQGNILIVRKLLGLGSDPTAKCSKGDSLQAAASKGHIPIVRLLIEREADVNLQGPPRGSPIQAAAYYGHLEVVKLLIEADADIYCKTYKFNDTLHASVEGGHLEVAAYLQEHHPPPVGTTLPAISRGDHRERYWYSEQGALDPSIELRTGTDSPHLEDSDEEDEIQETSQRDQNQPALIVNNTRQSPLVLASEIGNISRIRQELQVPQVSEEDIAEAFVVAVAGGAHQAIELLLDYGLRHCSYPRDPQERGLVAAVRHKQPTLFQRLAESLNGSITVISWCCALKEAISAGPDTTTQVLSIDMAPWERDELDYVAILLGYDERVPVFRNLAPAAACRDILQEAYSSGRQEVARLIWDWVLLRGPGELQALYEEWRALTLVAAGYADISILDRSIALQDECLDSADSQRVSYQDLLISAIQGNNRATFDYFLDPTRYGSSTSEEVAPVFLEACRQGFTYGALELSSSDGDVVLENDTIIQGVVAASAAAHDTLVVSMISKLRGEDSILDATESALLSAAANGKANFISKMLQDTDIRSHDDFETICNRVLVTACESEHLNVVQMCFDEGASAEATVAKAPSSVAPCLDGDLSDLSDQLTVPSSGWRPLVGMHRYPRPQPAFTASDFRDQAGYPDSDDSGESDYSEHTSFQDDTTMTDALQASVRAFGRILNAETMPDFESLSSSWRTRAKNQLKIVSLVLDHGSNLDEYDSESSNHPLRIAVSHGTDDLVERLLYNAAAESFNPRQLQDLMLVAARRRVPMSVRIIQLLLDCNHQTSLPTDAKGSVVTEILGVMEIAVKSLCTPARRSDIQSKQGMLSSEKSAKDLMKGGLQKLISTIFRKMSKQSAKQDAIGDVLHAAAAAGDLASVRLLIKHNVDVNHTRYHFHTALGAATEFGQVQVINALLRAKARIHPTGWTHQCFGKQEPAIKAIIGGQVQALKALIDQGLDPNAYAGDESLLVLAAQSKSAAMVKLLLQGKADPHANPLALLTAVHDGDLEMMTCLLDAGAQPNALAFLGKVISEQHLCSPLYIACENGQTEAVLLLVERGADVHIDSGDRDGLPLVVAARHGHLDIVKFLLKKGCDPRQRSKGLEAISQSDRTKFLRALSQRNLDLDQGPMLSRGGFGEPVTNTAGNSDRDDNGFLHAIESACDVQHGARTSFRTVEVLSDAIHDSQEKQDALLQAIRHATKKNNARLFEELLGFVTMDSVVLDLACRCGSLTGVKMILSHGIDAMAPNQDGKLPLEVAVEHEHMELVDLLVHDRMLSESKQDETLSLDLYYLVASILEAYAWSALSIHKSITACVKTIGGLLMIAKDSKREMPADQEDLDRALTLACHVGSEAIATTLLQLGANLETLTDLTQHVPDYYPSPLLACITNNHPSLLKVLLEWISDHGFSNGIDSMLEEGLTACFGKKSPVLLQTFLDHARPDKLNDHHLVLAIQQETWERGPMESDIEIILQRRPDLKPSELVLVTLAKTRTEGSLLRKGRLRTLWQFLIERSGCGLTRKVVQAVSDRHAWQGLYDYYSEQEAAHELSSQNDYEVKRAFGAALGRVELLESSFYRL